MTTELQHLYDTLGTVRAVAEHLGMSTGAICAHLRRHGVRTRHRGGDWTRMPSTMKKIEANRAANALDGDPAFRARPAGVRYCSQILIAGLPKRCVIHDLPGACETCRAEHTLDSVVAGASSSWTLETVGAGR